MALTAKRKELGTWFSSCILTYVWLIFSLNIFDLTLFFRPKIAKIWKVTSANYRQTRKGRRLIFCMDTTLTLRIIHRKYKFAGLKFLALLAKKTSFQKFCWTSTPFSPIEYYLHAPIFSQMVDDYHSLHKNSIFWKKNHWQFTFLTKM